MAHEKEHHRPQKNWQDKHTVQNAHHLRPGGQASHIPIDSRGDPGLGIKKAFTGKAPIEEKEPEIPENRLGEHDSRWDPVRQAASQHPVVGKCNHPIVLPHNDVGHVQSGEPLLDDAKRGYLLLLHQSAYHLGPSHSTQGIVTNSQALPEILPLIGSFAEVVPQDQHIVEPIHESQATISKHNASPQRQLLKRVPVPNASVTARLLRDTG
mmetsp:Transcript_9482/g.20067  ORF Transcript_9482/g.20067 Transcript_9482/m.20067 type:complete len:210 (-) Transcript_9482:107-736(-)